LQSALLIYYFIYNYFVNLDKFLYIREKMTNRIMVVTGGNKGIGFSIVKLLAQNSINNKVILTSRNVELGLKAVENLALPNVSYMQLDICDKYSIQKFAEDFKKTI